MLTAVDYDDLVKAALTVPFEGWDFGVFRNRYTESALPWSYEMLVRQHLPLVDSVLDLGTGGGELLASLTPLPARTCATEGFARTCRSPVLDWNRSVLRWLS